jgi:hypothetical protein
MHTHCGNLFNFHIADAGGGGGGTGGRGVGTRKVGFVEMTGRHRKKERKKARKKKQRIKRI